MRDDLPTLAAEAYGYGYPLLQNLHAVGRAAAFNTFVDAPGADPDLLTSTAQLDLSGGPIWLRVPATGGRYHVIQFIDAWTNNFAYVGSRTTPDEPREYLLVPPGWAGREAPAAEVIRVPTMIATLIARFPAKTDLTLQRMYPQVALDGLPAPQAGVPDDVRFLEELRRSLAAFPPSPAERRYQRRFAPLGVLADGNSPFATMPREQRQALREGLDRGREALEEAATTAHAAPVNGWTNNVHAFDYNLDYFEVGTVDAPQWTLRDREHARHARAVAARTRLWGSHGYESVTAALHKDGEGNRLTGAHTYTLALPPLPNATLAAYTALDPRPIATIPIEPAAPTRIETPGGEFHLILRIYAPDDPTLPLPALART
ncbi:DUF1254 domain-containing protein [Dactylosporangium matsuzakiense]|uniref:DUF1254 domain-containing protein n=1 Tax=Dactylosporangium matsuzakiense TaxID=53360 RepID=A0A9W6KLJ6_9ACTN|nr:DUF1254 domain-containing protein [Dactylosporangium matsuzakiense]UWZ43927.1 DUF1254 domain-containing protein [Dactylosporangium matsuzakiense]GLL03232.1 hypothetical protein GCM10017581_049760 [Dactylosporangium matsuzakiense]